MLRQLQRRYARLPIAWLVDGGFVKLSDFEQSRQKVHTQKSAQVVRYGHENKKGVLRSSEALLPS